MCRFSVDMSIAKNSDCPISHAKLRRSEYIISKGKGSVLEPLFTVEIRAAVALKAAKVLCILVLWS